MGIRQARRGDPTERILQRRSGVPRRAIGGVVDQRDLAQAGVHRRRGGRDVVDQRNHRVSEPRDLGNAEHRLKRCGRWPTPTQPVDVFASKAALADDVDTCFGGQRSLTARQVLGDEAGGGRPRDGHPVLHRHASSPLSTNTGMAAPERSDQPSRTAAPIRMSSLAAPTTVEVNRRPGCSSSSTVTTG